MSSPHGVTVGERLRLRRLELGISLRDVCEASLLIASRLQNEEFALSRSRLSEIETRDTLPNAFRLYSLAEIYEMDLLELLSWYGIDCAGHHRARAARSGGI